MDFSSALASLPYVEGEDSFQITSYDQKMDASPRKTHNSLSFNGVDFGSLPSGMTDEVDIDPNLITQGRTERVNGDITTTTPMFLSVDIGGKRVTGTTMNRSNAQRENEGIPMVDIGLVESQYPLTSTSIQNARQRREDQEAAKQNFEDLIQGL